MKSFSDKTISQVLHEWFGLSTLRPFQTDVIRRLLEGRSVLAVVSTGSGKSLCYQLPSLMWERPTLIVSPLVALMHHQADRMQELNIAAEALTGQIDGTRQQAILDAWQGGSLRQLYVSPERLQDTRLVDVVKKRPPALLVIDEAHCISEWGYDFRPEYRRIRPFREQIGSPPILALTATATDEVKADILFHLALGPEAIDTVQGSVDRPNLYLQVDIVDNPKEQRQRVQGLTHETSGGVIIYTESRRSAERWAEFLQGVLGETAYPYHAGLAASQRRTIETAFAAKRVRIVAATSAFGMGIDRGDIRRVIHVAVPESLDAYYQEIGRAGRDGQAAEAIMVIQAIDRYRREHWIMQDRPDEKVLSALVDRLDALPETRWVTWEVEEDDTQTALIFSLFEDMGVLAQKSRGRAIQVRRIKAITPYQSAVMGRLQQLWERRRTTFAEMEQYLESPRCRRDLLLAHYGQVAHVKAMRCCDQCASGGQASVSLPINEPLISRLRAWRAQEANEQGVPLYWILSDQDLMGLALKRPASLEALALCRGFGEKRLARYGSALLDIIQPYQTAPQETSYSYLSARDKAHWHFNQGTPWDSVQREVGRSTSTLREYFVDWLMMAPWALVSRYIDQWFNRDEYLVMVHWLDKLGDERLRPLYEAAEGQFGYEQWDVARALWRRRLKESGMTEPSHKSPDSRDLPTLKGGTTGPTTDGAL